MQSTYDINYVLVLGFILKFVSCRARISHKCSLDLYTWHALRHHTLLTYILYMTNEIHSNISMSFIPAGACLHCHLCCNRALYKVKFIHLLSAPGHDRCAESCLLLLSSDASISCQSHSKTGVQCTWAEHSKSGGGFWCRFVKAWRASILIGSFLGVCWNVTFFKMPPRTKWSENVQALKMLYIHHFKSKPFFRRIHLATLNCRGCVCHVYRALAKWLDFLAFFSIASVSCLIRRYGLMQAHMCTYV